MFFPTASATPSSFSQNPFLSSANAFNVFNSDNVLSRYRYATGSAFTAEDQGAVDGRGRIEEVISPSIFRLGVRLTF